MKLSNLLLTSLIASSITNCVAQKEQNKTPQKTVSEVKKETVDIIYPPNGEDVKTIDNSTCAPIKKPFVIKPIKNIKPPRSRHRENCPACGKG